ncbi:hypothetical protein OnM2_104038 [Erysiphe neolycopersici]|uniref:Uncharacterized protein n=1 Tax=Erysiphe neolycopersici TaxID=212602 RepID=A0A420H859_9PEZI|nr:hypothetical protein OnM2_104038 [Erysiphe neolycopersici]
MLQITHLKYVLHLTFPNIPIIFVLLINFLTKSEYLEL